MSFCFLCEREGRQLPKHYVCKPDIPGRRERVETRAIGWVPVLTAKGEVTGVLRGRGTTAQLREGATWMARQDWGSTRS